MNGQRETPDKQKASTKSPWWILNSTIPGLVAICLYVLYWRFAGGLNDLGHAFGFAAAALCIWPLVQLLREPLLFYVVIPAALFSNDLFQMQIFLQPQRLVTADGMMSYYRDVHSGTFDAFSIYFLLFCVVAKGLVLLCRNLVKNLRRTRQTRIQPRSGVST